MATIEAFTDLNRTVIRKGQVIHPVCKYPARFEWLSQWFELPDLNISCPEYDRFYRLIFPEQIWYVFSSYYLNNPSSSFGHSLLRFERKPRTGERHNPLLDHGVNFAAVPDTENPLLYAMKGMAGQFQGQYSILPYYFKVREYSDFESRDLWSYRLTFSQKEKKRLVQHLWELGGTYFDYYFFTENCSYQLLTLLDVAKPGLDLTSRIPYWVIPSETVRVIAGTPGLVNAESYRPSLYRKYKTRKQQLSPAQQDHFDRLIKTGRTEDLRNHFTVPEAAAILDTALDFTEFQSPSLLTEETKDPRSEAFKFRLLKARASLSYVSPDLKTDVPATEKPDQGHGTARSSLGLSTDSETRTKTWLLEQRFAYHDFLDEVLGYPPHALIEFMTIGGKIQDNGPEQKLSLDKFSLIKVQSLKSFTRLEPELSWLMDLGARQESFRDCDQCVSAFAEAGFGLAHMSADDRHSLSAFLSLPTYIPTTGPGRILPGLSIRTEGIFQLKPGTRMQLKWTYRETSNQPELSRQDLYGELRQKIFTSSAVSGFFSTSGDRYSLGGKIFYYY